MSNSSAVQKKKKVTKSSSVRKGKGRNYETMEESEGKEASDAHERVSTKVRKFEDGPPSQFECSISCDIMNDPVICADGFTYDRQSIELWLSTHDTSPMSNAVLSSKTLLPNMLLKELIDEYKANLNRK